jgi:hypothetical protein
VHGAEIEHEAGESDRPQLSEFAVDPRHGREVELADRTDPDAVSIGLHLAPEELEL